MSRELLPRVEHDAKLWGCDVERTGRRTVISLLGEHLVTLKRSDMNAELRAAHQLIADATGHQISGASSHKRARSLHRAEVGEQRSNAAAMVTDLERQITARRNADRHRKVLTRRYFDVLDIERLMGA